MSTTPRLPTNRHFDCMRLCQERVWGCRFEDGCELLKPKTELAAQEAPRSPAQPDASELLRELREVLNHSYHGVDTATCRACKSIARIDAFLRGGSGG